MALNVQEGQCPKTVRPGDSCGKAGPLSVERLNTDLPFCDCFVDTKVHSKVAALMEVNAIIHNPRRFRPSFWRAVHVCRADIEGPVFAPTGET